MLERGYFGPRGRLNSRRIPGSKKKKQQTPKPAGVPGGGNAAARVSPWHVAHPQLRLFAHQPTRPWPSGRTRRAHSPFTQHSLCVQGARVAVVCLCGT